MWTKLSHRIIKYRLLLVIIIGLVTVFMGYKARLIEWSYEIANVVPADDPEMQYFQEFKQLFGEDGNIVAVGVLDSSVYETTNFRRLQMMSQALEDLPGVNQVISLPILQRLKKNSGERSFQLEEIFPEIPDEQNELDSMLNVALEQKFYSGQLINPENGALLILITINKEVLNSFKRVQLTKDIIAIGDQFTNRTDITVHFAGLPFVRSVVASRVKAEMLMFIAISVAITGVIMLLFFRSWRAVIFPMTIIGVVIVWVLGFLTIFEYKINILTGVIPSIIVVIGIPNSIYLLNKYHQEYENHGNKVIAISRVTRKIGFVTLITNFTTAIGFLVLGFTDITVLREFGLVAGLNIMATFVVSIVLLPAVFFWMPAPRRKHLKHLQFKGVGKILTLMDLLVHRHKYKVFVVTAIIIAFSISGLYQVYSVSYMVDDIPEDSRVIKDLRFFENNFSGIMPLEILVDTGKKRGVMRIENLEAIERFEKYLESHKDISQAVSVVSFIKASRQAFYGNNPAYYDLPNRRDRNFIFRYFQNQSEETDVLKSFIDSTAQVMRISLKVADIGSQKMDSLINEVVEPQKEAIFEGTDIEATITGTTPIFIKGNRFLIENLKFSFVLAFLIIAMIMALLFANLRMIIISLIPNIIPLLITAGIMGYFAIPLKPSTAIVFSIAFGISVDYSIHFLAKYRQELFANNFFVPLAVSKSIREIGSSMIYTSIVLFAGFVIFAGSDFGGTVALGFLTSTTLLMAMFTNLIVLPSLILAFDTGKRKKNRHPLIEHYEEFYEEGEDEEIDISRISVTNDDDEDSEVREQSSG